MLGEGHARARAAPSLCPDMCVRMMCTCARTSQRVIDIGFVCVCMCAQMGHNKTHTTNTRNGLINSSIFLTTFSGARNRVPGVRHRPHPVCHYAREQTTTTRQRDGAPFAMFLCVLTVVPYPRVCDAAPASGRDSNSPPFGRCTCTPSDSAAARLIPN